MPRMRRGRLAPLLIVMAAAAAALAFLPASGSAEDAAEPRAFETPEALVAALLEAAEKNDDAAIRALVGVGDRDLVEDGGDPSVAQVRQEFARNARAFWALRDGEDGRKTLVVGAGRWPLPVPLVKIEAGWVLDAEAGREELIARRIGHNEIGAIKICRAYLRVQEQYRAKDRDGDRVREYAQRIRSTPGTKDGLYWDEGEDGEASPLGPFVEEVRDVLAHREPGDPVSGYYWRILTGQGGDAPGGTHSYVVNGNMIAGCALLGYPARYGESGVMTFMVSHHGRVLQRDLGEETPGLVRCMTWFCPDPSWHVVED
jgi:hypothetical protein